MVRVTGATPPGGGVTYVELRVTPGPAGLTDVERDTGRVNPPRLVTLMVEVPLDPWTRLIDAGSAVSAKSSIRNEEIHVPHAGVGWYSPTPQTTLRSTGSVPAPK